MIAICIAPGPSLTKEDVDYCRGKGRVYVINNAYKLAPWANVLYACDGAWWDHYQPEFAGEKYTIDLVASQKYNLNLLGVMHHAPWSDMKDVIVTGNNSGFQALNLAVIQGAEKVVLLGYDMKMDGNKRHFDGNHPGDLNKNSDYKRWITFFNKAKPYIKVPVINCTRSTALDVFPCEKLENVI